MANSSNENFEINFFESILKRSPKDTDVLEILGGLYTREGRVDDGLRVDRRLVRLMPDNPTAHYNLACSLALKKRNSDAVKTLRKAIQLGYKDFEWLLQDPDLDNLKKYPAFKELLTTINPDS